MQFVLTEPTLMDERTTQRRVCMNESVTEGKMNFHLKSYYGRSFPLSSGFCIVFYLIRLIIYHNQPWHGTKWKFPWKPDGLSRRTFSILSKKKKNNNEKLRVDPNVDPSYFTHSGTSAKPQQRKNRSSISDSTKTGINMQCIWKKKGEINFGHDVVYFSFEWTARMLNLVSWCCIFFLLPIIIVFHSWHRIVMLSWWHFHRVFQ